MIMSEYDLGEPLVNPAAPDVAVLQVASDGNSSLYQVQVNAVPVAELQMEVLCGHSALVELRRDGIWIDEVLIANPLVNGELHNAHLEIAYMLRRHYPNANVTWHTRGLNVEH